MAPINVIAWDGIRLQEGGLIVSKINDRDAADWRLRIRDDRGNVELDILGDEQIKVLQRAINGLFPEGV